MDGALRLFDGLIQLKAANRAAYESARTTLIAWIKEYPLKTNKWGPFFEGITGWSDTEINVDTMAWYILQHRGKDAFQGSPNHAIARRVLDWTLTTFGTNYWSKNGVTAIQEQTAYRAPGNSHTSRHASVELLYAEESGDTLRKEDAIRQLNWATYMVDDNGKNRYPNDDIWLTDGYGDYGRISRELAKRGAYVLGLDLSRDLLAEAERRRGDLPAERLRYQRHDLRMPLPESGFDVALNIFSSLGYGSEDDDIAVLSNLRAAVRPGGLVFVETMHRDRMVANLLQNPRPANRLPDGTLLVEEPRLDPIAGRVETTWYWSGPGGSGQKSGSIRVYTATELVKVVEAAGLRFRSAHNGCSTEPFVVPGSAVGGRLGLLAARE